MLSHLNSTVVSHNLGGCKSTSIIFDSCVSSSIVALAVSRIYTGLIENWLMTFLGKSVQLAQTRVSSLVVVHHL
jgi:hypothetical protein